MEKRWNARTAIATALSTDRENISPYQPTRVKGVYQDGVDYYTLQPELSKDSYTWEPCKGTEWFTERYGKTVFRAVS